MEISTHLISKLQRVMVDHFLNRQSKRVLGVKHPTIEAILIVTSKEEKVVFRDVHMLGWIFNLSPREIRFMLKKWIKYKKHHGFN